jgi:hypothetical protein
LPGTTEVRGVCLFRKGKKKRFNVRMESGLTRGAERIADEEHSVYAGVGDEWMQIGEMENRAPHREETAMSSISNLLFGWKDREQEKEERGQMGKGWQYKASMCVVNLC